MSDQPSTPSTAAEPSGDDRDTPAQDVVLDLTFVPAWARQPPGRNPYAQFGGGREAPSDRRRDRFPRGERRGEPGRKAERPGPPTRGRRPDRFRRDDRPAVPDRAPLLPVDVWFIPEKRRLGTLAHEIQTSGRAFRLADLAHLFLSRPEHHSVKIEVRPQATGVRLYQCRECKAVFLDKAALGRHGPRKHLDLFYEKEEKEVDPPSGNFVCVARCTLSGTLLGPPNHHSYNQRMLALYNERFAHLSLVEYRKRIELVRDPELIEKWKQENRKRVIFREKTTGEEKKPEMDQAAAEAHFLQHHAAALALESPRLILPATVTHQLEDPALNQVLQEAWNRESRRAFTLNLALRPALRHMRMQMFRANGDHIFVTAIPPHPLDPTQAVKPIRKLLNYLAENPGCTRQQLIEGLKPGTSPDSPAVAELINSLRWLTERGHVIEFYDGTLAVPRSSVPPKEEAPAKDSARSSV